MHQELRALAVVLGAVSCSACLGVGAPKSAPPPIAEAEGYSAEEAATFHRTTDVENWDDGGDRSRFVYRHPSEFFPHAVIHRGGPVSDLVYDLNPEIGTYESSLFSGARTSLDDYVTSAGIDGFVLLHRGRIVYEVYPDMQQHDKHIAFSVTKAVVGTVVGILEDRGEIDLGQKIEFYIPELAGTAWAGIEVLDILDMASGMENGEADPQWWLDPLNTHFQLEASLGWMPRTADHPHAVRRGETYRFLKSLRRVEEPGKRYQYNSANTAVLGWLLEQVKRKPLAEVLSEEIWSKLGAESDALIGVNENGIPIAHGGMATTLRDLARFGLLFTESWEAVSDRRVISEALIRRIQESHRREPLESLRPGADHVAYHWDGVTEDGAFFKGGFAGQLLIVYPSKDVVIAYFGTNVDLESPFPRLELTPLVEDLF